MADTLQLIIITPEREFFHGDATFVEFTTTDGDVGIFPKHVPTTVVLDPGVLRIHQDKEVREAALHSGFAEILPDKMQRGYAGLSVIRSSDTAFFIING